MDAVSAIELDPVLHQPLRTRLMAYLATRGEATFTELKQVLDATDGNLEAHIKKLTASRYLKVRKENAEVRTQTIYSLTPAGKSAFDNYVDALQRLLLINGGGG